MDAAHDETLGDTIASMTQPLTRPEQLEMLASISQDNEELAAVLDHLCIQVDFCRSFIEVAAPAIAQLAEVGEQLASGGIGGMMSLLMSGPPEALTS